MEKNKKMLVWVLIVLAVIGILVVLTIKINQENKMTEENNQIEEVIGGAKVGDLIKVNYTGKLENGTVFDSNVDPKFNHVEPFEFTLGAGQVIPGWDKGLMGMKVGDKKTLVISPEDAYGERGAGGIIPPNATLIFEVEVLDISSLNE